LSDLLALEVKLEEDKLFYYSLLFHQVMITWWRPSCMVRKPYR